MGKCIVPRCPHSTSLKYTEKIRYHMCREAWVEVIERSTGTPINWSNSSKICHVHFKEIHRDVNRKGRNILKNTAVPTLFGDQCPRYKNIKSAKEKKTKKSSEGMMNSLQSSTLVQASTSKQAYFPTEEHTAYFVQDANASVNNHHLQQTLKKGDQLEGEEKQEEDDELKQCSDLIVTSLMNMIIKLMHNKDYTQNMELLSNLLDLPENSVSDILCKCRREIMKNHKKMYNIFANKLPISHEKLSTMKHFMESYLEILSDSWKKLPGIESEAVDKLGLEDISSLTSDGSAEDCVEEEDSKLISTIISLCTQNIMEYHAKMINCFKEQKLAPEDCKKLETPSMLIEVYFTVINELWQKLAVATKHNTPLNEPQVKLLPERRSVNIPATLLDADSSDGTPYDYRHEIVVPGQLEEVVLLEEQDVQQVEDGLSVLKEILKSNKELEKDTKEILYKAYFEETDITGIDCEQPSDVSGDDDVSTPLQHDHIIEEILYKPWENKHLSSQFLQEMSDEEITNQTRSTLWSIQHCDVTNDQLVQTFNARKRIRSHTEEDDMLQEIKMMKLDPQNDFKEIDVPKEDDSDSENWQEDLVRDLNSNLFKYSK